MPIQHTPADDWLQLDRQLCFALYSASHAMTRVYRPLLEPLGLTYPQYLVLMVLWEQDDRTLTELGDRLALDSGTLTPLVKRLETQGLLRRQRDPADERRVRVQLLDAGRALRGPARGVPQALAAATGCSLGEIGALVRELHALRGRLQAAANDPVSVPAAVAGSPRPA